MKKFFYLFILISLTGCFNGEEKFACDDRGLIITKEKATYSYHPDFQFCGKVGVVNVYKTKCIDDSSTILYFDTVAKTLSGSPINGSLQCKKEN
jgi:hypothetical protein